MKAWQAPKLQECYVNKGVAMVMTNNQNELAMIIEELTSLQQRWNLRLNKKKSEILTKEDIAEIGGINCKRTVKYLGVKVTCDRQEQMKISRE